MVVVCATLGLLAGIAASLPVTFAFRAGMHLAQGLVGIIISFITLTAAIAAERVLAGTAFIGYAVISVLAYLGIVTAAALRHERTLGSR